MTRKIDLYLKDILQNMIDAEEFVEGLTYEQFANDKKAFNSVVRSIEVIGEAAKNIPDEVRVKYPAVPWKEMSGMRDKVIHFYFGVDREAVWLVVKERIPTIKTQPWELLIGTKAGNRLTLDQQPYDGKR